MGKIGVGLSLHNSTHSIENLLLSFTGAIEKLGAFPLPPQRRVQMGHRKALGMPGILLLNNCNGFRLM
jgi:hypothetical protein